MKGLWNHLRREGERVGFRGRPTAIVAVFLLTIFLPRWWTRATGFGELSALALELGVPVAAVLLWRERLAAYGLGLGDVRAGARISACFALAFVPCFVVMATDPELLEYYSLEASTALGEDAAWQAYAMTSGLSLLSEELRFRGFLLFGLARHYGPYAAVLSSLLPYVYGHAAKPPLEALGSFPVGIALAYLALRTGSIWYGWVLHALAAGGVTLVLALSQ